MKRAHESGMTVWPLALLAVVLIAAMTAALVRGQSVEAKVGGKTSPDGAEIHCDLPGDLHQKNTGGSDGAGLCVFASMKHTGLWQNDPAFASIFDWMKRHPGGGYPEKVDRMLAKMCAEKGLVKPDYIQVTARGQEILDILKLACRTGRMPGVTYSKSPTGRYGGSRIAHMVSMPHCDEKFCAILDNNYIGEAAYEWVTPDEFLRVCNLNGSVWAVILLSPGPPPPPRN